jgi:hypothetical protein
MRRDFVLPAVLAAALAIMAVYATTGDSRHGAEVQAAPVECRDAVMIATLRELPEASGLAASKRNQNLFWSHNDSADAVVYGVAADGAIAARVRLTGATIVDWEAVTTAECASGNCLYVGDIGDNDRARRTVTIYRTAEPGTGDAATEPVTKIEARYPEGPQDAEALLATRESLYIVTKGEGTPVRVYRLPATAPAGVQTLQLVASLTPVAADKSFRITDAALSLDQRWLVLRSNDVLLFYDAKSLFAGAPTTPLSFDLRSLNEPQGEGVAWSDSRTLFLAGERSGGGTFARISCNLPS